MPTAVAVSPHLDDAVFSCGGLLAVLSDAGWSVSVVTVFTESVEAPTSFALACQLDKGLPASVDYMALRREEDAAACACVGAAARWLPFREAPHRGYLSAAALFGRTLEGDDVDAAIASALGGIFDELAPDLVLGPQAIGGHVDHVLTVKALRGLADRPALWWQDFPYLARGVAAARPFSQTMEGLPERALAIDMERKRRACAAYRTQIGFQFGGQAGLSRALSDREKFRECRGAAVGLARVGGQLRPSPAVAMACSMTGVSYVGSG